MHALLITILASLSSPSPTDRPDDDPEIDAPKPQDQHFCCDTVGPGDGKGGGEGCVMMAKDHGNTCLQVLYCAGNYTSNSGTVTCY